MKRWAIGAALMVMAGAGSFPSGARSISMHRPGGGDWTQAAFVCDATNRDRVMVLSPTSARSRRVQLWSYAKPGLAGGNVTLTLGQGDAGMSQVYYPLADQTGRAVGWVHAVSPGVVEPGATTPTVTSLRLGGDTTNCRFAPQTRVLGATAKRSVQVTATDRSGYRYRSYDYDTRLAEIAQPWGGRDTRASTSIDGGRLVDQRGARRVYEFAKGGFVYRVMASVDPARGGGGVQVLHAGRVVLAEPFGAYTAAVQP